MSTDVFKASLQQRSSLFYIVSYSGAISIVIFKLNIFPDVVFMEVHDGGKIEEIFRRLQAIPELRKRKFDYPSFLPHISIMHFQENKDFTRLIGYLEKLREAEFGKMTVHSIELVNVHLLKKYPKLNTIHTFELR